LTNEVKAPLALKNVGGAFFFKPTHFAV